MGWRPADFVLTGRDFDARGALFDQQLRELSRAWSGEPLRQGTRPVAPPPIQSHIPVLVGGTTDATLRRVVEHAVGWTAGGLPPDAVGQFAHKVRDAWHKAKRELQPRIVALVYFGLGDTEEESRLSLLHYYEPRGPDIAGMIAGSALRSPADIRSAVQAYAAAGVDELILDPTVSDPAQVDLLAEVVFG